MDANKICRSQKYSISNHLARFREVLEMIPEEYQPLFSAYFLLSEQHRTLKQTIWDNPPLGIPISSFPPPNPDSQHYFMRNPIAYLTAAHNCVDNFANTLKRSLKMLFTTRNIPFSKEEFLELLDKVRLAEHPKFNLSEVMKRVVRIRILYPLAPTKTLAQRIKMTPHTFNRHLEKFRTRFELFKVICYDWYKLGLSRVFIFLHFKKRRQITTPLPATDQYFEAEVSHRLPMEHEVFSIQIYTPPRSKWNSFKYLCKETFNRPGVRWFGEFPSFFYSEGILILLNLETYDNTKKRFTINETYIDYCLSTDLFETLPAMDFSPALSRSFDIKTPRVTFDALDLLIIQYFYELEGTRNRFVTTKYVASELGVSQQTVARRIKRMLHQGIINFYYRTPLRLPRMVSVVLLFKEERLRDSYLNLITTFPYSVHTKICSFPKEYVGVGSTLWVPHGSRIPNIFRDFLLSREDIIGFCAEAQYQWVGHSPLVAYWDEDRNRWK